LNDGAERFATRYPRIWHVIEADGAGAWLDETGLLPTASLLRMAGTNDDGINRSQFLTLSLGRGRIAVIRPQLMPDDRLVPTLAGSFTGEPRLWRKHVNAHVFFWTDPHRRDAFLRACQRLRRDAAPPGVIELDTASLLRDHAGTTFWSRINIGSTLRGGGRTIRDDNTLLSITTYRSGSVAELAVRGRVVWQGHSRT
jgi:hypothetical protein